jgi:hypothetical protein
MSDPGENERSRRGHVAAVVAELIDMFALNSHRISESALS